MTIRDAWLEKRLASAGSNGNRNVTPDALCAPGRDHRRDGISSPGAKRSEPEFVRSEVARGRAIIPANINHRSLEPMGIGVAFNCKINANIGNSAVTSEIAQELEKLHRAVHYGSDTVMDLSTGGDIPAIRRAIIEASPVPVGTVPIYEALSRVKRTEDLTAELMLEVIEEQAEQGVDYMTIHAGVMREFLPMVRNRITGIVSRGGALMAQWMAAHKKENFLYERFDDICKIFKKHDVSFSLGDGLRPGSIADASDAAQFARAEGARRSDQKGLGARCAGDDRRPRPHSDGPDRAAGEERDGAVPRSSVLHAGPAGDRYRARLRPHHQRHRRGHDRMVRRFDAVLRHAQGAPGACPTPKTSSRACIAYKIAAHAADVARHRPGARDRDDALSYARFLFDWNKQFELSLDPETARAMHDETLPDDFYKDAKFCSMCGPKFCSMNITQVAEAIGGMDQTEREQRFVQLLAKVEK